MSDLINVFNLEKIDVYKMFLSKWILMNEESSFKITRMLS